MQYEPLNVRLKRKVTKTWDRSFKIGKFKKKIEKYSAKLFAIDVISRRVMMLDKVAKKFK